MTDGTATPECGKCGMRAHDVLVDDTCLGCVVAARDNLRAQVEALKARDARITEESNSAVGQMVGAGKYIHKLHVALGIDDVAGSDGGEHRIEAARQMRATTANLRRALDEALEEIVDQYRQAGDEVGPVVARIRALAEGKT